MQTRLLVDWKEVNVWSSTVYSCDFHEGRQHFITLLMFVLNFVLFFNLFTVDNNFITLLPARASEQGNVIGSVRIYIYIYMCVYKKKL